MPVHYNKYIKIKLNIYNKKTDTNFYGNRISENDKYCACLSVISLDSIGKWKNIIHKYSEESKYALKKENIINSINDDLNLDESDESDDDESNKSDEDYILTNF